MSIRLTAFDFTFHRLAFNFSKRVIATEGSAYEYNYNHQLRRVLETFDIQLVVVVEENFDNLRLEGSENYLIRKAIESCRDRSPRES